MQEENAGRQSAINYQILVQGALDESWADSVGDMTLEIRTEGGSTITCLEGTLPDQAALSGVLNLLYDLGLSLVSVEQLEDLYSSGHQG